MAEAVAIVGLLASIASLVDVSVKFVSRLHEFSAKSSDVPESFRSLSARLPLLTATLEHIKSQAEDGRFPGDLAKALKAVVDDTSDQISDIQACLSKVFSLEGASKRERALKALRSLAKENNVQRALEKIDRNNDILVLHQTTQHDATGDRILEALSKLNVAPSTRSCASSTIPFGRDPDFIDRGAILEQLREKCALPASRTALVGFGGVGKSQLAIELGYRTREKLPETWVVWVHAGSTARLEQGFRSIAECMEIAGRQDPKADIFGLVHDWLRDEKNGRWLLILDNLDNTDTFAEFAGRAQPLQETEMNSERRQPITSYLPYSQHGSILVTSRRKDVALKLVEEKDIMVVQPMAPPDALSLFQKKLGTLGQGEDKMKLAAALDYIPLAIVQAAAFISQRAPRYSVQRYHEEYQRSDHKKTSLLNYEGGQLRRDWQAQNSIIITWQISFEYIHQNWPSATDLLSLMSFCDRQGIPEVLVRPRAERGNDHSLKERVLYDTRNEEEGDAALKDDISEHSDDDKFEDDVQTLKNYSFLSTSTDGTFEMHALVQLATRKWLEANRKLEQWKQRFIENLYDEFPTGEYQSWTKCQILFPHVRSAVAQRPKKEHSLRVWASLLYLAAWYSYRRGSIAEAIDLSEAAFEVKRQLLGHLHEETLSCMSMVGLAYDLGGRWKEAEEPDVRLIEMRKSLLGEDHIDTLGIKGNLALIYKDQGRLKEAEELSLKVLKGEKEILGDDHLRTISSMGNLATIYREQGRLEEAEELEMQVLERLTKTLGEDNPDTLTGIGNLASIYVRQERCAEAEQLDVQVVEMRKKVQGEDHPDTLVNMANLASTYFNQRRWEEAETLEMQVLNTRLRVLGEEHPHTLNSKSNLASTYLLLNRRREAEELGTQALEAMKRVIGEDHFNTLICMANLSYTLKSQNRTEEAISVLERCHELQKRTLGPEHPDTESSLRFLENWRKKVNEHGQSH